MTTGSDFPTSLNQLKLMTSDPDYKALCYELVTDLKSWLEKDIQPSEDQMSGDYSLALIERAELALAAGEAP